MKKDIKALLLDEPDFLKSCIQGSLQEILEAELTEALGVSKYERSNQRADQRAGYYPRSLVIGVGKIELRIPRDRQEHFSTRLFERYLLRLCPELCANSVWRLAPFLFI